MPSPKYWVTREELKSHTEVLSCVAVILGGLSVGNVLGWSSCALPQLRNDDRHFTLTADSSVWITAVTPLAAIFSGFISSFVHSFGSKNTLIIASIVLTVGWIAIAIGHVVQLIMLGRFLCGLGVGVLCLVGPTYSWESAEDRIHRMLTDCSNPMIALGIFFVNVLGVVVWWDWLAVVCSVVPVLLCACLCQLPDSPTYLTAKGDYERARESVRKFHAGYLDSVQFVNSVERRLIANRNEKYNWKDCITTKSFWQYAVILLVLMLQNLSGLLPVIFHLVDIFAMTDIPPQPMSPNMYSVVVTSVMAASAILSMIFFHWIKELPNRFILSGTSLMIGSSFGLFSWYSYQVVNGPVEPFFAAPSWTPVFCMCVYAYCISSGFISSPWLFIGLVLNPKEQEIALNVASSFFWSVAFILVLAYRYMIVNMGFEKTFLFFSGFSFLAALVIAILFPSKNIHSHLEHMEAGN